MPDTAATTVEFSCTACGRKASLPSKAAGNLIVCPGCGLRCRVPKSTHAPRASLTKLGGAGICGIPSTRPAESSSSLRLNRQDPRVPFPVLILAVAGGGLLTVATIGSAVILRRAHAPPATLQTTTSPDESGAGALPVPADSPPTLTPPATERSVRVVKLEGRSEVELREALRPLASELTAMNAAAAADHTAEQKAALIRLRMYRLLCGLPEDELVLDDRLNEEAGAAAKVCHRLGYLSHEPPNPGLPDAEFAQARRGAGSGNLAFGMRDLVAAVDGWMDDSDADNVAALGHRRWCLNPPLRRLGFGRSDRYFAMWAHDSSGSGRIPQPAICFPPPGCVPIDMFRPHYAWSVTLDPRAFQKPTAGLAKITIRKQGASSGSATATDLDFLHIDTGGYGIANCIIFRPVLPSAAVGSGYEISLEGIRDHDGRSVRIMFATKFVDLMPVLGPIDRH